MSRTETMVGPVRNALDKVYRTYSQRRLDSIPIRDIIFLVEVELQEMSIEPAHDIMESFGTVEYYSPNLGLAIRRLLKPDHRLRQVMRGEDGRNETMFSYVQLDSRVAKP